MEKNNVITGMFSVIDAGRFDDLEHYLDPQVVYERPGYEAYTGLPALLVFYKTVRGIREGTHSIKRILCDESSAMCSGHFEGVSKDGILIDIGFSEFYSFNGNRIKFRRTYFFQPAV